VTLDIATETKNVKPVAPKPSPAEGRADGRERRGLRKQAIAKKAARARGRK